MTTKFVKFLGSVLLLVLVFLPVQTLAGCSSSDDDRQQTVTVEMNGYPDALAEGTLQAHEQGSTVYFLLESDEFTYGLVLPPRYGASTETPTALLDGSGTKIATAGEFVTFGGGEYPQGGELWNDGPTVDAFWIFAPRG